MVAKLFFFIITVVFDPSYVVGSNLLAVTQIYRHGQRTPTAFYPTDPYQDPSFWPASTGQLTNTGKRQHYALGQYVRNRYSSILPKKYTKEQFRVETTNMDRTFMSAASDVAGLFPPVGDQIWKIGLNWQPIPVFPVEVAVLSSFETCSKISNLIGQVISTDPYYVNIDAEYQELYAYLSNYTGSSIVTSTQTLLIWDTLFIENQFNFKLPSWTDSVFPEPLKTIAATFYQSYSFTEELRKLTAGPFLKKLVEHFEAYIADSTSTQQYLQFSAHDINLSTILNALNPPSPQLPGFASTIFFELREQNGINYINIYYRNNDVVEPIIVDGCDFDCEINDFKSLVSKHFLSVDEWHAQCDS